MSTPPPSAAAPARPLQPPRPPKPRVPGPGRTVSLIVLGLALLALAASVLGVSTGTLGVLGAGLVAAGAVVGLLGLGVTISALRGRRGGWMTGFGWLAAFAAVPALALGTALPSGSVSGAVELRPVVVTVTDRMLQDAAQSTDKVLDLGSYGAANVNVDLTKLGDGPYPVKRVKIQVGSGAIRLFTTQTQSIEAITSINLGELHGEVHGRWTADGAQAVLTSTTWPETYTLSGERLLSTVIYENDGLSTHATLRSETAAAEEPALSIEAVLGMGEIAVSEKAAGSTSWSGYMMGDYWIVDSWIDAKGKSHSDSDLPIPDMTHPVVSAGQANQCLTQAKTLSAKEYASQNEEDLTSYDSPDEWVTLDNLNELSSTAKTAMASCLDQVIATGSVPKEGTTTATDPSATPSPSAEAEPTATQSAQPAA